MLLHGVGEDNEVVDIYVAEFANISLEDVIEGSLEEGRSVGETKGYSLELEQAGVTSECCFLSVFLGYGELVVSGLEVQGRVQERAPFEQISSFWLPGWFHCNREPMHGSCRKQNVLGSHICGNPQDPLHCSQEQDEPGRQENEPA